MRVSIALELIAQHVFDWTLAAIATVAMPSKRPSLQ
jgi:hypothetical protein